MLLPIFCRPHPSRLHFGMFHHHQHPSLFGRVATMIHSSIIVRERKKRVSNDDNSTIVHVATSSLETVPVPSTPTFNGTTTKKEEKEKKTTTMVISRVIMQLVDY
mmetsp:Transcript_29073/g.29524  ORF Transcript_29073/g.29524 Transcript_29073/m.29524 type:complete len:105 (+) Transcript_29073:81-395(+)